MITFAVIGLFLQTAVPMISLPAGNYQPLYGHAGDAPVAVAAFRMDRDPVTRRDYLQFVRTHTEWRRSTVAPLFADKVGYLAEWRDDLDAGGVTWMNHEVTGVSWYAARAYCESRSARLPTVAEWEYAAAASHEKRYASRDRDFIQRLVSLYATRATSLFAPSDDEGNFYGLRAMHSLGWEWVEDFNSVLVSDDSRSIGARDHNLYCAGATIGAVDPANYPAFLRYGMRAGLNGRTALATLSFRCAA